MSVRRARLPFRLSRHSTTSYRRFLRPFFDRHFLLAFSSRNARIICIVLEIRNKTSIQLLVVGPQNAAYLLFRQ